MGNKASKKIKIITVNPNDTKRKSLAEIVRTSPPLSIILLKPGMYEENEPILIENPIQIIGIVEGKQKPIIISSRGCFEINCQDKVIIKGLELKNIEGKNVIEAKEEEKALLRKELKKKKKK